MNAPARLGLFGVALVAVLGGGAALGAAVGPTSSPDAPAHEQHQVEQGSTSSTTSASTSSTPPAVEAPHAPEEGHP